MTEGSEPGAVHGAGGAAPVTSGGPHSGAVFVSYASQDAAVAQALCAALEREGVACWIAPRDVRAGESYAAAIVQAINTCRMLLLVLSRSAIESPHVLREVERASSKRRPVLSVQLDGAELTPELEYFLSAHQWLDASGGPIEQIVPALIDSARARAAGTPTPDLHHSGVAARATPASHTASYPSDSGHGLPFKLSVLEQLKRRHVGRVAVLYVAVCYLILEPFSTFLHVLALPEWTGRVLMGLMVLGFPAAMIFAWVFEPAHVSKSAPDAEAHRRTARLTGRRLDIAIIIVLAIALAYFAADKFWLSKREKPEQVAAAEVSSSASTRSARAVSDKSIAVLPFVNLSEKHDQEYFSDGLAEEVLSLLATLPDLKVISRTSSFQFKGHNADLRTIGAQLGAAYVVEGSVRRSGDRVRVTAQLISSSDGLHRWSDTYEQNFGDVLRMQQEIAAALGRALQVEVGSIYGGTAATLANTDAYSLYLHGLHSMDRDDKPGLDEAISYFERALSDDPTMIRAREKLAHAHYMEWELGLVIPAAGADHLRRDLDILLREDHRSSIGHALRAELLITWDWDWAGAGRKPTSPCPSRRTTA